MADYSRELSFIFSLCDRVDEYTLAAFLTGMDEGFDVQLKGDCTPFTVVDQSTEKMIRDAITTEFSEDSFEGEEFGVEKKAGTRNWVVDPIDGTKNFISGVPVWGTLIALCVDDVPVLGVVSAPGLSRRWWGVHGDGAFVRFANKPERRLHVNSVDTLDQSEGAFGNIGHFPPGVMDTLVKSFKRLRGEGDFWSHMLVAEGARAAGFDAIVEPYDIAALAVIVREAGGRFTSWKGDDGIRGGTAVSTNGHIHDQVLDLLR